jgi:hypothetical protein
LELEAHLVRHAEHPEHLVEHRHDKRAAADAEQPGEDAGDDAGDDDQPRQQQQFAHRFAEYHHRLRSLQVTPAAAKLALYFNLLLILSTEKVSPA